MRLFRGETADDTRPNKSLDPRRLQKLLAGYEHVGIAVHIAAHGITPHWHANTPSVSSAPRNHKSATRYHDAVLRSVGKGQKLQQYLVATADVRQRWPEVRCSPFGAVEKKDVDSAVEVRLIHDLSYPRGASTNDQLDKSVIPDIPYTSVTTLARRIEYLASEYPGVPVKILKGDVKGALRHLMDNADHVRWMCATLLDLAAPFGWSGSPVFYSVFGRAITWLVQQNSPSLMDGSPDDKPFFGYEWVDDHILVEPDIGTRLDAAATTLRLSMPAVLGPGAINEEKFSPWSSELQALDLVWNTTEQTVSMPADKIQKCINRIAHVSSAGSASRTELQRLLGSFRQISLCLRAAKPFYQRLHVWMLSLPSFGHRCVTTDDRNDLQWFDHIFQSGSLDKLPLRFFGALPEPDLHLYMDASNAGLAVLNPACRQYIQVRFDADELAHIKDPASTDTDFSINVREHICVAFAQWTWGATCRRHFHPYILHIRCWSDNSSAVSWSNRLASSSRAGQEINRAIGLAEAIFRVRASAGHLPGAINTMADAGSRAWTEPHLTLWTSLASGWEQVSVPQHLRRLYKEFSSISNPKLWPSRPSFDTSRRGASGVPGARRSTTFPGSRVQMATHHNNSLCSPYTASSSAEGAPRSATQWRPSSPSSARLAGITGCTSDTQSTCSLNTTWLSEECSASVRLPTKSCQSLPSCSRNYDDASTSASPTTVSCGEATILGFFFLLRRSEYLTSGRNQYRFAIRRSGICFLDICHQPYSTRDAIYQVRVNFRGGKNDQAGVRTSRSLCASPKPWCFPICAARFLCQHYDSVSVDCNDLLCKVSATEFLQARHVCMLIKAAAHDIGADQAKSSLHSLRIGGATALSHRV